MPKFVARLSGRIYWNFYCPECDSEMSWTLFGNILKHKKNQCRFSGTKWKTKYPSMPSIEFEAEQQP